MAGLSIGFRSQMAILTMPLLLWVFVAVARTRVAAIAAAAAGVAVWALPLVWFSGGPRRYLQALGSQAGEDFSGVVMLWTHPTPRAAVAAILQTFVRPWDSPILAGVMLVLAAAGAFVLLTRSPRVLAIVAVAFGPYAVFHLLFQETHTIRYALPLVPLIGYLAAVVLTEAGAAHVADRGRRAGWCQPGRASCRLPRRTAVRRVQSSRCSPRCAFCRSGARGPSSACTGGCSPSRGARASMRATCRARCFRLHATTSGSS